MVSADSGYKPYLFVDSGGYKLLYNEMIDLRPFNLEASVEGILSLQKRFGGDFAASLDYPIRPDLSTSETQDRIGKTISNAVKAARVIERDDADDRFFYAVVHGRNRKEAKRSVEQLAAAFRGAKIERLHLGIAIGSLVPLHNSPSDVLDVVQGVVEGVRNERWPGRENVVPIHAFGVSGPIMPAIAALGVDSFDSATYVQCAMNLKYMTAGALRTVDFFGMDGSQSECHCEWCKMLGVESGFEQARRILRSKSNIYHSFSDGPDTHKLFQDGKINKSYIYALIALHNYEIISHRIELMRDDPEEFVLQLPKVKGISQQLEEFYPGTTTNVESRLLKRIFSATRRGMTRETRGSPARMDSSQQMLTRWLETVTSDARKGGRREVRPERTVSFNLNPHSFDVNRMKYKPEKKGVMLILACTQQKPYSRSPTHRMILKRLAASGIKDSMFEKVTVSGNYGPVPEEYEMRDEILGYDYHLTSLDSSRIKLLSNRMAKFLERHASEFDVMIAYVTTKAYREVIERAKRQFVSAKLVILPSKPRARKASELRKDYNLEELVHEMKRSIGRRTE
jgi:predicted RNA-binding protein